VPVVVVGEIGRGGSRDERETPKPPTTTRRRSWRRWMTSTEGDAILSTRNGRLVVVGGFGVSRSFRLPHRQFADKTTGTTTTSDVPSEASVHFLDGRADQNVDKPAWWFCSRFRAGSANTSPCTMPWMTRESPGMSSPPDVPACLRPRHFPDPEAGFDVPMGEPVQHPPTHRRSRFLRPESRRSNEAQRPDGDLWPSKRPGPSHAGPIRLKRPMPALFSDNYFTDEHSTAPDSVAIPDPQGVANGAFDKAAPRLPAPSATTRRVDPIRLDQYVWRLILPWNEAGRENPEKIYDGPNSSVSIDRNRPRRPAGAWRCLQATSSTARGRRAQPREGPRLVARQRPDDVFTSLGARPMDSWLRGIATWRLHP